MVSLQVTSVNTRTVHVSFFLLKPLPVTNRNQWRAGTNWCDGCQFSELQKCSGVSGGLEAHLELDHCESAPFMEGFATIWGLPVLTWLAVGSTHLCSTSDPRCLLRNVEGKRKPFVCIQWSLAGLGPHCGNQRVQVEVLFLESVLFIYWQGEQCFFF